MSFLDRLRKKDTTTADAPKEQKAASESPAKQTAPTVTPAHSTVEQLLIRPVITEKATLSGTYIFEVARSANKSEVAKAIKSMYGVTPKHVRIMNVGGKKVRWGRMDGERKSWKKAVVRLNAGETINVYEGT